MKKRKIMACSVKLSLTSALVLAASLWFANAAQAKDAWLAWQVKPGEVPQVRSLEGDAPLLPVVPLGSAWKLFVYSYLQASGAKETPYRCDNASYSRKKGDEYCCDVGETIVRDVALARSCGAYFSPDRLGIGQAQWSSYWKARREALQLTQLPNAESSIWLEKLSLLQPSTSLSVAQILQGLASIGPEARQAARVALAPLTLKGGAGMVLQELGSGLRFKTFSWDHPIIKGGSIGGATGWLADGTPFWMGGQGVSRNVLARLAPLAKHQLPRVDKVVNTGPCVLVDFLTRYPIAQVTDAQTREVISSGMLTKRYNVRLQNQSVVTLNATSGVGEIVLTSARNEGPSKLVGRFTLNEYIARVIDREANAQAVHAARALAVAARSYLVQNASYEQGCFRISDDSRTQRVSLNPASSSARAAALATDELILTDVVVRYHRDRASPGVMSWEEASKQSAEGKNFTAIVRDNWPKASFALLDGSSECKAVLAAEQWLSTASLQWRRQLQREPGFEMPQGVTVCELSFGNPYTDVRRARIYVRTWQTRDGRFSLAHEFIHLAFAGHPQGSDEAYAERWARRLVDSQAAASVN